MFDSQKPTTQMLGRWQPWHDGHTELFKRALAETGQVCIMVRDVGGIIGRDAGAGRTNVQQDNPFSQKEAVCTIDNSAIYFTDEYQKFIGGRKIYKMILQK